MKAAEKPVVARQPVHKPCPICGKPADSGFAPFCSKRCADVDLHRWLRGTYAVPSEEQEDVADED